MFLGRFCISLNSAKPYTRQTFHRDKLAALGLSRPDVDDFIRSAGIDRRDGRIAIQERNRSSKRANRKLFENSERFFFKPLSQFPLCPPPLKTFDFHADLCAIFETRPRDVCLGSRDRWRNFRNNIHTVREVSSIWTVWPSNAVYPGKIVQRSSIN